MLAAKDLLDSLDKMENEENYKCANDDFDFGEVLKFYVGDSMSNHQIRYDDEQKNDFSFDT